MTQREPSPMMSVSENRNPFPNHSEDRSSEGGGGVGGFFVGGGAGTYLWKEKSPAW